MSQSLYPQVQIKPDPAKNVTAGHPWVFSGGIETATNMSDGGLCEVFHGKRFLGIGYFNSRSDIRLRLLTTQKRVIDANFFIEKLFAIKERKMPWLGNTDAWRWVFGESDGLPGLVIDVYRDIVVVQIHTLGMELLKNYVVAAIRRIIKPRGIYEKSEIAIREREGLPKENTSPLFGNIPEEIIITENGFRFAVNIVAGQKTGFFLDQRENRKALMAYTAGRNVINCFCYTGGFSVYAAANAESVTSIDISKPAIAAVRRNFELNGYRLCDHEFIAADVFDYLKDLAPGTADLIILDPPALAKNRAQLKNAIKAYITLNSKALEKLPENGILVSSSCTTHVDEPTFLKILHQSAVNTGCRLNVLESRLQPADHTFNLSFPEGRYLKFFVLQKIAVP